MKISNILIGVAGVAVGAGALFAYNKFIGGGAAPAEDAEEYEDEEPTAE